MIDILKNIEALLNDLTANHRPELSIEYMIVSGQQLCTEDKRLDNAILFEEKTAEGIYNFMRTTIGTTPFIVE